MSTDTAEPMEYFDLYCDGGIIAGTPSLYGGTAAWCQVDLHGNRIAEGRYVLPAPPNGTVENNLMEWIAAVLALESVPDRWYGTLHTDSNNTLGRLTKQWALNGIPAEWLKRGQAQMARLGPIKVKLLAGHPSERDLAASIASGTGLNSRGKPISEHNVWCDKECNRLADLYLNRLPVYSNIGPPYTADLEYFILGPPDGTGAALCPSCRKPRKLTKVIEPCACGCVSHYIVPESVALRYSDWARRRQLKAAFAVKGGELQDVH